MRDRDAEIERICQAALDCAPEARPQLLARECGGDEEFRRQVESLLALEAAADRFLEPQALRVPSRLGPYEIHSILGSGGMGEVYQARDTVLGREVALKVLPRSTAADPERIARLQREARTLAALNHPNVAQIYGIEQGALVMELVDGRILKGPVPLDTALEYGRQIAAALEAAHEKGVVHRDLKPGNVMTTAGGDIKVLDFGLAAIGERTEDKPVAQEDVTATATLTRSGAVMGTPAYMSPEQAAGKPADKRTDIWSFGVLLYELMTGRRLFEGDTTAQTIDNVRTAPIDLRPLPRDTPAAVRDLLARCLDRDSRTRLRDIGEARIQLQSSRLAAPATPRFPAVGLFQAAAWLSLALAVLFAALYVRERRAALPQAPSVPVTFQVQAPPETNFVGGPAISPDGRQIAFTARGSDGTVRIWVHSLGAGNARALAGTEGAFSPLFWSPDSRFVGFAAGMTLKKAPVAGGPPFTLCDRCGPSAIGSRVFRGGAWNAAGVIVYAISSNGLWRIPDSGGTPTRVTPAGAYGYPSFLPDGERILYTWFGREPEAGVYVGDLRREEPAPSRRIVDGAFVLSAYAAALSGGHLFTLREGVLTARPFDPVSASAAGEAVVVAQDVPALDPPAAFSVSRTGALAFSSSASADRSRLLWVDRGGGRVGQLGEPSYGSNVSISPDGRHIAFDTLDPDRRTRRMWSGDAARGIATLVNSGPRAWIPAASPSGDVAFASPPDIYLIRGAASAAPEILYRSSNPKLPNHWSPDGRFLAFNELHPTQRADLYVFDMSRRAAIPLVVTDADEWPATFSPDGRWIAYSSDESGRREIYVRDFAPERVPAVGSVKRTISTSGGDKPRWSRDGSELYYLAPDGRLMVAGVRSARGFDVDLPAPLFMPRLPPAAFPYDVAADGRFLVSTLESPTAAAGSGMTVVMNWTGR